MAIVDKWFDGGNDVNGYGKHRPWMDVTMKGVVKDCGEKVYKIHLGEILRKGNINENL